MATDSGRAPSGQALVNQVSVPCLGPSGFDPSRIRAGDDVEYYIEGGWTVVDGRRESRERARVRVCCVYDPPKHGKYLLGVCHPGSPHEGLLCLSEVTAHHPAIATEARRAETTSGSVLEGAGPKDIAHD